jgi:hypothetical protein
LFGFGAEILMTIVYLALVTIYFWLDVIWIFWQLLDFLFNRYLPPNIAQLLANFLSAQPRTNIPGTPIPSTLYNLGVPNAVDPIKQFYLFAEKFIFKFLEFIAQTIEAGLTFLDTVLCNIIRDPKNCLTDKICKLLIKSFWFEATPGIWYYVDLNKIVCKDILNIIWNSGCRWSCDLCGWKPFDQPIDVDFWYEANAAWYGNAFAGYSFAPCNIRTGCCAAGSSSIQWFFPQPFS